MHLESREKEGRPGGLPRPRPWSALYQVSANRLTASAALTSARMLVSMPCALPAQPERSAPRPHAAEVARLRGARPKSTNLFLVGESEETWRKLDKK